jgi:hypothetical protein
MDTMSGLDADFEPSLASIGPWMSSPYDLKAKKKIKARPKRSARMGYADRPYAAGPCVRVPSFGHRLSSWTTSFTAAQTSQWPVTSTA